MNKPSLFKYFLNVPLVAFIVAVFSLTLSVNVSAASQQNSPLPYLVEDSLYFSFETYKNAYDDQWGSYYPIDWDEKQILFWSNQPGDVRAGYSTTYMAYKVSSDATYEISLNDNVTYDQFDTRVNTFDILFNGNDSKWYIIIFREYRDLNRCDAYGFSNTRTFTLFGSFNPTFLNGGTFNYVNGVDSKPVLISDYETGTIIPIHPPTNIPDAPDNPPDVDDYIPNYPPAPTIDTTSPSTILGSIFDLIKWGFNNTYSTLKGIITFIADIIKFSIQKLITNIYNGFNNLYQNLNNFIKPFFDNISIFLGSVSDGSLFTSLFVPSSTDVYNLLVNNDKLGVYTLYNSLKDFITGFILGISQLQTQKTFWVPPSTYHNVTIGGFYLDFSWFDNYKTYSDSIISGFMIIGWIYWLFINLSSVLRGGSSVAEDNTGDHLKSYEGFIGFH